MSAYLLKCLVDRGPGLLLDVSVQCPASVYAAVRRIFYHFNCIFFEDMHLNQAENDQTLKMGGYVLTKYQLAKKFLGLSATK